jgi:hypothetical protein
MAVLRMPWSTPLAIPCPFAKPETKGSCFWLLVLTPALLDDGYSPDLQLQVMHQWAYPWWEPWDLETMYWWDTALRTAIRIFLQQSGMRGSTSYLKCLSRLVLWFFSCSTISVEYLALRGIISQIS